MAFKELAEWYLGLEKVKALASYWLIELSLKKFNLVFGDTVVSRIKLSDLENYQAKRKKEGKADGTIDHEIGKAKTMVFKAFDNDLISGDTLRTFKKTEKMVKRNSDARNRILGLSELDLLLDNSPRHLKGILAIGFYAGMRRGEILNLTWDKVILNERIIRLESADTKDREPRTIPICDRLYEILMAIPQEIGRAHV